MRAEDITGMRLISQQLVRAIAVALIAAAAQAALPAAQQAEIDHLLKFVRQSTCKLERNGKYYDGVAAAAHMQKKFGYFREDIHTTEQFIELSATRSTLSGRYYMVRCGNGDRVRTRDWLLQELGHYRANGSPPPRLNSL